MAINGVMDTLLVGQLDMVACPGDPCKGMEVSTANSVVITPCSAVGKEIEVSAGNSIWNLGVDVF